MLGLIPRDHEGPSSLREHWTTFPWIQHADSYSQGFPQEKSHPGSLEHPITGGSNPSGASAPT